MCVKGIKRALAKHRRVVLISEFNTTKMHHTCQKELTENAEDRHEKTCLHCEMPRVRRDMNAALNILRVWTTYVEAETNAKDKARPAYLDRPVHPAEAGIVAVAAE